MSLFEELKRRNVFRVGVAYLVIAWLVAQFFELVLDSFDAPAVIIQTVLLLLGLGLPVTLILAWVFEITPEGVMLEKDVERSESITHITGRNLDYVIIGVLAVAVTYFLIEEFVWDGSQVEQEQTFASLAVLPFDFRSVNNEDAAFFAGGIHDDLITLFSKLSDIRVISRQSVERFKDTSQSIQGIASTLGVTAVLEGSVRVAGDRVRINVQLTDAMTETNLWAAIYDRELTAMNIFGIQSEVALSIVNRLQAELSPDERQRLAVVPTQSLEAYEAYLLGKQEATRRTIASLQGAVEQFQQATQLDPDFALAYVGLADSYALLQDWGYLTQETVRPLISEAATKALELDSQLGEAYVSLASIYEMGDDYAAAEDAYTRAIELNPGYATAHSWYGLFLRWRMGRIEEAVEHAEQALILDPLSAVLRMAYGDVLSAAGRFDNALAQYRRSIELDPQFGGAHRMIADHYLFAYGRTDDALDSYRNAVSVEPNPEWIAGIGEVYLVLGDTVAAERFIDQALLTDPDDLSVSKHLALLNYYRGQDDLALDFALKALEGPFYVYTPYMLFIVRNADLRAGRYADARRRYEQFYPTLAEEDAVVHLSNYRAAIDLSVVLARMGETQRSQRLLEKSLLAIRDMPRLGLFGYGSADAEILALQGRPEEALTALRLAVEDGWLRHWFLWTELNPNLDSIRDDPEYGAIIAKLESDMATELTQLQARATQLSDTVL